MERDKAAASYGGGRFTLQMDRLHLRQAGRVGRAERAVGSQRRVVGKPTEAYRRLQEICRKPSIVPYGASKTYLTCHHLSVVKLRLAITIPRAVFLWRG